MTNHPNRSKRQQAQHTPGPCHIGGQGSALAPVNIDGKIRVWAKDGGAVCDVSIRRTLGSLDRSVEAANANLIAEAFNVATETGLTPRQLADQRTELLAELKGIIDRASDCFSAYNISDQLALNTARAEGK